MSKNFGGYIMVSRSILDSKIWREEPELLKLFLYLILNARFDRTPCQYPTFQIKRGELVTSLRKISDENTYEFNRRLVSWSPSKVARMIDLLEENGYIKKIADTYGTHLSVCNYDIYQDPNTYNANTDETAVEHEWNDSETTVGTNNNDNNDNNDKNDNNTLVFDSDDNANSNVTVTLRGKSNSKSKPKYDYSDSLFQEFWEKYPKKEDKKNAYRAWLKLTDDEKRKAIEYIDTYTKDKQYQFIRMPSTYLNAETYNNEIPVEHVWKDSVFRIGNERFDGFEDLNTGIVYYPDKKTIFYDPKEKK